MQELIIKLEFFKAQFQKKADEGFIDSADFFFYLGIVQGFDFAIDQTKKINDITNQ